MVQAPAPVQPPLVDIRVPRYTSYPPANHFSPAIGPETHASWLGELNPSEPVSLYVHIPFCRRLCLFCACRTQGTSRAEPLDRYLDHLEIEIGLVAAALPGRLQVVHLHLGGGTPTLLSAGRLGRLGAMIRAAFDLAEGAEIAVEVDPTEIDAARLDALAALGVTRASLGIQDFDPHVQSAIGRRQSVEQTLAAAEGLRERGVASLNVDLLYGLPFQTTASLHRTLQAVERVAPDRIALYGYAHVPWAARRQRLIPEASLPDGPTRLALFDFARRLLLWRGYRQVGIDHFAMPGDPLVAASRSGTLRRNFQGYTTDRAPTLIGLGASAISRLPQGYAQNLAGTADWQDVLGQNRLATQRGHALGAEDRARGAIVESLLCSFSADIAGAAGSDEVLRQKLDAEARHLPDSLKALVDYDAGTLRILVEDGLHARLTASHFDAYLRNGTRPYSVAS